MPKSSNSAIPFKSQNYRTIYRLRRAIYIGSQRKEYRLGQVQQIIMFCWQVT
jgi:hypothetical protein